MMRLHMLVVLSPVIVCASLIDAGLGGDGTCSEGIVGEPACGVGLLQFSGRIGRKPPLPGMFSTSALVDNRPVFARGTSAHLAANEGAPEREAEEEHLIPEEEFGREKVAQQIRGECGAEIGTRFIYPPPPKSACENSRLSFRSVEDGFFHPAPLEGIPYPEPDQNFVRFNHALEGIDLVVRVQGPASAMPACTDAMDTMSSVRFSPGMGENVTFLFVNSSTGQPVVLKSLLFTVMDIDQESGCDARMKLIARGFQGYYLANDTAVLAHRRPKQGGFAFQSTMFGSASNNPTDPLALTPDQANIAVELLYLDVSNFTLSISWEADAWSERQVFFAGRSSLTDGSCKQ